MNARPDIGYVPEIEQEVLGALLSGGSYPVSATVLETRHFVHEAHKLIYEACGKAYEATGSCKLNLTRNYIDKDNLAALLKPDTPNVYYLNICQQAISTGHARLIESCKKVVEQWARLTLSETFYILADASNDVSANVKQIASRAGEEIDVILSDLRRGTNRKTRFSILEASQNALKSSQEARERGAGLTGITWGLSDVNRLTGGLQKRDLTLIAARPSMGKTTVAMHCALEAAKKGFAVGFISLEMDAEKVAARQISNVAYEHNLRIAYSDILKGNIEPIKDNSLEIAVQSLENIPLYIEDQPSLSLSDIRVKMESLMERASKDGFELDALFIDHIGLIKASSRYSGNRVQEVTELSGNLKSLAREYNIGMGVLSQLSRALESRTDKRPMLSDLRESGALEQDADTVIFLYREAYYLERQSAEMDPSEAEARLMACRNQLEFIIAKQRNGPITTINLFADMAYNAIRSAA